LGAALQAAARRFEATRREDTRPSLRIQAIVLSP
jgi:hypothetical protein